MMQSQRTQRKGAQDRRSAPQQLPLSIVEDHDDALPVLYRAIGDKSLPFDSVALIHFDAHPDLLSPDIKADDLTNTTELYSCTSIADWILPAVYMGHVGGVVWLKPSWATQIPNGEHPLIVGKDKSSGHIRVATPLSYFISELLYVPKSQLDNIREIPLIVVTVTTSESNTPEEDINRSIPPPVKRPRLLSEGDIARLLSMTRAWVLDFDLDFFSTGNPYRGPLTKDQYELLKLLYRTPFVESQASEQVVIMVVEERTQQLALLNNLWCPEPPVDTMETLGLSQQQRPPSVVCLFAHLQLHTCGLLTELPLHISSEIEVARLLQICSGLVRNMLSCAGAPKLITVARSSEDDYTPSAQVERIQEQLLLTLEQVCVGSKLSISYNFLDKHEQYLYESPGEICDCSYL